jgi:hypothetical protein
MKRSILLPVLMGGKKAAPGWQIAGKTPVRIYVPKGAASLAASYVNLATPGTGDATLGTAQPPSWDAVNGWGFDASLPVKTWLKTGWTPTDNNITIAVKFGAMSALDGSYFMGMRNNSGTDRIGFNMNAPSAFIARNGSSSSIASVGTLPQNKVVIMAGKKWWIDGVAQTDISSGTSAGFREFYIGVTSEDAGVSNPSTYNLLALWIANIALDASQVALLQTYLGGL